MEADPFYSYAVVTRPVRLTDHLLESGVDQISETLQPHMSSISDELTRYAREFAGGGWEVLSHDTVYIRRNIVLRFLMRRPATEDDRDFREGQESLDAGDRATWTDVDGIPTIQPPLSGDSDSENDNNPNV